jgi:hypothetical protein
MDLDALAKHLSDPARIGLDEALAKKLGLTSPEATRGRLLAQVESDRSHLQVLFLGCFVVDDTDFFGDGEVYWWSIPTMIGAGGKATCSALHGLPTGMPPHRCGDQEWLTNLSLAEPPLWAVIPPEDEVGSCVIRLGIYDDDRAPADLPGAIAAGIEVLAGLGGDPLSGAEAALTPVRDAIFEHLKAADDDILIEQDLVLRKGEVVQFGAGMIGSIINSMARAYYFVRDTQRTRTFGPVTLHKGQMEQVKFDGSLAAGGRIAIFARGHDVSCPTFGDLGVDMPFVNRVLGEKQAVDLQSGFSVLGTGPAKLVAYYTPPR